MVNKWLQCDNGMLLPQCRLQDAESCRAYNLPFTVPGQLARSKEFINLKLFTTPVSYNSLEADDAYYVVISFRNSSFEQLLILPFGIYQMLYFV